MGMAEMLAISSIPVEAEPMIDMVNKDKGDGLEVPLRGTLLDLIGDQDRINMEAMLGEGEVEMTEIIGGAEALRIREDRLAMADCNSKVRQRTLRQAWLPGKSEILAPEALAVEEGRQAVTSTSRLHSRPTTRIVAV